MIVCATAPLNTELSSDLIEVATSIFLVSFY